MTISIDLLPSALGFYRGWGGGGSVAAVNDASDATYDQTNGGGTQSYAVDDLPSAATEVVSVTLKARLSQVAGWNGIIPCYVLHNGDLVAAVTVVPTTSAAEYTGVVTRPGGGAWTTAEVNALEVVVDVVAGEGFDYHAPHEGRNHRIWLTVVYNDVPPAPTNLTAVVVSTSQVDLAWSDNATNETAYKVERADGPGGAFVQIAGALAVNTVTYSDTTVVNNTLYTYRVRASNASGNSEYTNLAVVSVGVVAPDQASFSKSTALARFEVLQNVKNHGYGAGEYLGLMALRFDVGGGEIGPKNFNAGAYDNATALAAAGQVAMRAAAGAAGNETLVYSNSTHRFTVGRVSGNIALPIETGDDAFKAMSFWTLAAGFNPGADKAAATSHTADLPTFESADEDHIFLASINGFQDLGGEYTGTGTSRISIAPDISRCLIERWGPLPRARFNLASFEAGRLHAPSMVPLFVWIAEKLALEEILARIENGALAHVVMDSTGMVHYVPYSDTTVRREFFDRDFVTFKSRKIKSNVYRGVRLHYGVHPHTGQYDSVEWTSDEAETLHARKEIKDVWTYIRDKADAETAVAMHGALATAAPIELEFTSRSKLVDLKLADVIAVTRSRCAVSPTGELDAVNFKIVELRHSPGSGESYCYAMEQIDLG